MVTADNGSTDLARRYRPRFKALTLVDSGPRRGHPAPRNAGAKAVLPGVRVPDPAGLLRPCRRGGADHRRAGGGVADDRSGRHDGAGRRERDRGRPARALAAAMHRTGDEPAPLPEAAAGAVLRAVARARCRGGPRTPADPTP